MKKRESSPGMSYKLIYNPNAGKKRKLVSGKEVSLEYIQSLFEQYQIPIDFTPTKGPGHAIEIARESVRQGYSYIVAAGGDGTINETANGLIGSDAVLGILPLGSFMNIARMLSIPSDLEKAVCLLKIQRTRKIDVGVVTELQGKKPDKTMYFIEGAGVGLDAEFHRTFLQIERGHVSALLDFFNMLRKYRSYKATITIDGEDITGKALMITISNGPFTGAALKLAPDAKLNDHKLTVTVFAMSKSDLIGSLFRIRQYGDRLPASAKVYQGTEVSVTTERPQLIHADALSYGTTPITCKIYPNAINVITGFPAPQEDTALKSRTMLDP